MSSVCSSTVLHFVMKKETWGRWLVNNYNYFSWIESPIRVWQFNSIFVRLFRCFSLLKHSEINLQDPLKQQSPSSGGTWRYKVPAGWISLFHWPDKRTSGGFMSQEYRVKGHGGHILVTFITSSHRDSPPNTCVCVRFTTSTTLLKHCEVQT